MRKLVTCHPDLMQHKVFRTRGHICTVEKEKVNDIGNLKETIYLNQNSVVKTLQSRNTVSLFMPLLLLGLLLLFCLSSKIRYKSRNLNSQFLHFRP